MNSLKILILVRKHFLFVSGLLFWFCFGIGFLLVNVDLLVVSAYVEVVFFGGLGIFALDERIENLKEKLPT